MTFHDLRNRVHSATMVATAVGVPSATIVEALSATPFDALCIDAEHTPLTVEGIESLIRAADINSKPVLVRVPEVGAYISRVLDSGAAGIIVPRVETKAEAEEVVRRSRYAPEGRRGAGPGRMASYGAGLFEHVSQANSQIMVAVQIESAVGMESAESILSTPGIDAVVIGPGDLAISLGAAIGSPEHSGAIDRIFEVADRFGVAKGAFCFSHDELVDYVARGPGLLVTGSDLVSVIEGAHRAWGEVSAVIEHSTETRVG